MNVIAMLFVLGLHIERRGNRWSTWEVDFCRACWLQQQGKTIGCLRHR